MATKPKPPPYPKPPRPPAEPPRPQPGLALFMDAKLDLGRTKRARAKATA
jgi:hypothetical protein